MDKKIDVAIRELNETCAKILPAYQAELEQDETLRSRDVDEMLLDELDRITVQVAEKYGIDPEVLDIESIRFNATTGDWS